MTPKAISLRLLAFSTGQIVGKMDSQKLLNVPLYGGAVLTAGGIAGAKPVRTAGGMAGAKPAGSKMNALQKLKATLARGKSGKTNSEERKPTAVTGAKTNSVAADGSTPQQARASAEGSSTGGGSGAPVVLAVKVGMNAKNAEIIFERIAGVLRFATEDWSGSTALGAGDASTFAHSTADFEKALPIGKKIASRACASKLVIIMMLWSLTRSLFP